MQAPTSTATPAPESPHKTFVAIFDAWVDACPVSKLKKLARLKHGEQQMRVVIEKEQLVRLAKSATQDLDEGGKRAIMLALTDVKKEEEPGEHQGGLILMPRRGRCPSPTAPPHPLGHRCSKPGARGPKKLPKHHTGFVARGLRDTIIRERGIEMGRTYLNVSVC